MTTTTTNAIAPNQFGHEAMHITRLESFAISEMEAFRASVRRSPVEAVVRHEMVSALRAPNRPAAIRHVQTACVELGEATPAFVALHGAIEDFFARRLGE